MSYVPIKVWVEDGAYHENPPGVLAQALRAVADSLDLGLYKDVEPLATEAPDRFEQMGADPEGKKIYLSRGKWGESDA